MGPFHYAIASSRTLPLLTQLFRVLFHHHNPKIKPTTKGRLNFWCGRRESNPRLQLGKLTCYHYTTPADKNRADNTPKSTPCPVCFFAIFVLYLSFSVSIFYKMQFCYSFPWQTHPHHRHVRYGSYPQQRMKLVIYNSPHPRRILYHT